MKTSNEIELRYMDRYNFTKLIERKLHHHFFKFREELRNEYRSASKMKGKLLDKDENDNLDGYVSTLNKITYCLDSTLLRDNPYCDSSIAHIMKPIIEHYIERNQLTYNVLKAFE